MHRTIRFLLIATLLSVMSCDSHAPPDEITDTPEPVAMEDMLRGWSESFIQKVDPGYSVNLNFLLKDDTVIYNLKILEGNDYVITKGSDSLADFTFVSTPEYYHKIYKGGLSAFTALGRENMSDQTPLDFAFPKGTRFNDSTMNRFFFVVQRFFNKDPHDRLILEEKASRIVHGGHAIPIFYQTHADLGVRSAWYLVKKGQQINEPGDTNPFPQYMIVIEGDGWAKLGNDTIKVRSGEAYYIDPGIDHVIWNDNEEPVKLVWIAWGQGA